MIAPEQWQEYQKKYQRYGFEMAPETDSRRERIERRKAAQKSEATVLDLVKREAGESPARSRRCEKGVRTMMSLGFAWEDGYERGSLSQKTCLIRYCRTTRNWLSTETV